MFYLETTEIPTRSAQLAQSLASTLHQLFIIPPGREPVGIRGEFPGLEELRVDLTDATVRASQPPAKPIRMGQVQPGPSVRKLSIEGRPVRVEDAALNLTVTADDVHLSFDRDNQGRPLMLLERAQDGHVRAQMAQADLQALLLAGATAAAESYGLEIRDIQLDLTRLHPRSVAMDMRITAKKFVTAMIHIRGQLHVDDELRARLSDLGCQGDGMIGKMVCGVLSPFLQRLEGREVPLMTFSLGQVRLRDIQIDTHNGLDITARFGS